MRYLECECCGFLAVVPKRDTYDDIICPFCVSVACAEGKFIEITVEKFVKKAKITPTIEKEKPNHDYKRSP